MFVTKKSLSRRTMLRAMGAAVSLPFLESMIPAFTPLARAAGAPSAPIRRCLLSQRRHHAAVHSEDCWVGF